MTLAEGTRLGPCSIVAPLGAGGMGEVYRATDSRLKRQVAVKILPGLVRLLPLLIAALALGVASGWLGGRRAAVMPAAVSRLQMSVSPADQLTSANVAFRPVRHAVAILPDGRVAVFTDELRRLVPSR